jgi:uncharacterized protein YdaU (DUF1376 family)
MASENLPLPYYRWYVRDYRASRRVQRLTYVERGLYRELLDECWLRGAIPDDPAKLAEVCGCPLGVMSEAWLNLKNLFEPVTGLDGVFVYNSRLDEERTESDKLRAVRALAGRKGGIAKHRLAFGKQVPYSSSRAEQSSSMEPAPLALEGAAWLCPDCGSKWEGIHKPGCSQPVV